MLYKDPLESPSSIFLLSHTILLLARKILYQYETEKNGLQDKIIKIKTSRKSTINAASKYNHKKSNFIKIKIKKEVSCTINKFNPIIKEHYNF
jgi:hypothetical protein